MIYYNNLRLKRRVLSSVSKNYIQKLHTKVIVWTNQESESFKFEHGSNLKSIEVSLKMVCEPHDEISHRVVTSKATVYRGRNFHKLWRRARDRTVSSLVNSVSV